MAKTKKHIATRKKAFELNNEIAEIRINSPIVKIFYEEMENLYDFQNAHLFDDEPDSMFELDKENYLAGGFGKYLSPIEDYEEDVLLNMLISRVENAKHPTFVKYRKFLQKKLKGINQVSKKIGASAITAVDIAVFCKAISDLGIIPYGNNIQSKYCGLVAKTYNLNYSDKVRQNFSQNTNPTKQQYDDLKNNIIPTLSSDLQLKLYEHIKSKQLPKIKMYV